MNKNTVIGVIIAVVILAIVAVAFVVIMNRRNANNDVVAVEIPVEREEMKNGGKTLVVYYSASGVTEKVANIIKNELDADIFEIEPVDEYTSADLNWTDNNSRVSQEHNDTSKRDVALKTTTIDNWDEYDIVFVGYPIWWGIAAWPVDNFIKDNDFTGKTVIPFCTAYSSGMGQSGKLLEEMAGTGDWLEGQRFLQTSFTENDVVEFVKNLK